MKMTNIVMKAMVSSILLFSIADLCIVKTSKTASENVKKVEMMKDTIKAEKPLREAKKQGIKGLASHYGKNYGKKRKMANGDYYNPHKYTCAMTLYPMGSKVLVKNVKNGKSVEVEVTDRGPFVRGRVIDLSVKAAEELDIMHCGIAEVEIVKLS